MKKLELLADKKKESLPIRLQSYERMLLFCERINPVKLLLRVKPVGKTEDYLQLLLANIEQEYDHNMVQQLYITDACWNAIIASKTAVMNTLRQIANSSDSTGDFRENVMLEYSKKLPQTDTVVAFLKNEVKKCYNPISDAHLSISCKNKGCFCGGDLLLCLLEH